MGTSRWGTALAKALRQKGCGILQGGREKANTRFFLYPTQNKVASDAELPQMS